MAEQLPIRVVASQIRDMSPAELLDYLCNEPRVRTRSEIRTLLHNAIRRHDTDVRRARALLKGIQDAIDADAAAQPKRRTAR